MKKTKDLEKKRSGQCSECERLKQVVEDLQKQIQDISAARDRQLQKSYKRGVLDGREIYSSGDCDIIGTCSRSVKDLMEEIYETSAN